MIKKWNEYIKENLDSDYLSAKMKELEDLISNIDKNIMDSEFIYKWDNKAGDYLVVNFFVDDLPYRYELDLKKDTPFIVKKFVDGDEVKMPKIKTSDEVEDGLEEGLDIIENDIINILDENGVKINNHLESYSEFNEKKKAEKYKGHKIPGKYLTRKKGAMKKEIDTFRGKKEYKKDWEADIDKRSGKRIKTKKSAATKAYQRMFGK
jgi:hypothetical protein